MQCLLDAVRVIANHVGPHASNLMAQLCPSVRDSFFNTTITTERGKKIKEKIKGKKDFLDIDGQTHTFTSFQTMKNPIPTLYTTFKKMKTKKEILNKQPATIESLCDFLLNCAELEDCGAKSLIKNDIINPLEQLNSQINAYKNSIKNPSISKANKQTSYREIIRNNPQVILKITNSIKDFLKEPGALAADSEKFMFYVLLCLICSSRDGSQGVIYRTIEQQINSLPLPPN